MADQGSSQKPAESDVTVSVSLLDVDQVDGCVQSRPNDKKNHHHHRRRRGHSARHSHIEVEEAEYHEIERWISSGDLGIFYREGERWPSYAVFNKPSEEQTYFPTLLVKGRVKPVPLGKFRANDEPRFVCAVSAAGRVAFGDFETILVRKLSAPVMDGELLTDTQTLLKRISEIPFSKEEISKIVEAATTDEERALLLSTGVVAHIYNLLGVLECPPDQVAPHTLEDHMMLERPVEVKIPNFKEGPVAHGKSPLLAKIAKAFHHPSRDTVYRPYDEVVKGLKTGDMLLFSSVKSSGSLIKILDRAVFGHCGLVWRTDQVSDVFVWESRPISEKYGVIYNGVQTAPLRSRITSGWYDLVAVRRLLISDEQRAELVDKLESFRQEVHGRPFEKKKLEMIFAAFDDHLSVFKLCENEEDLSSIFCSELVAAAYQRVGLLDYDPPSNEYTPENFCSRRELSLNYGQLGPEEYIEISEMFDVCNSLY